MSDADAVGLIACLDALRDYAAQVCEEVEDPAAQADFAVKLLGVVMANYLQQLQSEPDQPAFLPSVGYHQMYGTPSPDTVYRNARVDGGGTYRITGVRGTVADVSVMPFGAPSATGMRTFPALSFDDVVVADDGTFEVLLCAERPEGATSWWRLDPEVRTLMLRSVSSDWGNEVEPRLALVRLDAEPRRQRPDPQRVAGGLLGVAGASKGMVEHDRRRIRQLTGDGVVNRLVDVDYSANGGRAEQFYQEGVFALEDDQVLLLEARLQPGCRSFSLALTDGLFSTVDWMNAQSSLNERQAAVDDDGVLRLVVAPTDPGLPNWLDTTGHRSGALQLRWIGGAAAPEVSVVVAPASSLPPASWPATAAVSPRERADTVRRRQAGTQLRGW